jgi:hypothetical protein
MQVGSFGHEFRALWISRIVIGFATAGLPSPTDTRRAPPGTVEECQFLTHAAHQIGLPSCKWATVLSSHPSQHVVCGVFASRHVGHRVI